MKKSTKKVVPKPKVEKTPKKSSPKKVSTPKVSHAHACAKSVAHKFACAVCFDDFPEEKIVACPFCPSRNCVECCQEYLLGISKVAHCMSCKKEWPATFFSSSFPEKFRLGAYVENRKKMLLEEQTAALPSTLPLVEAKKKEDALKEEIAKLAAIHTELVKKATEIREQHRVASEIVKNGIAAGAKKLYMFKCPNGGDTSKDSEKSEPCRGFIEAETHTCTLCKTQICKECHVVITTVDQDITTVDQNITTVDQSEDKKKKQHVKPRESHASHVCRKEDIETAKMVLKDTKPCPTCSARIFKTDGCDQMFCTQCQTAFSWHTGVIETGTIHNPHYYELMRTMGNNRRNAGDVPCGGLIDARFLMGYDVNARTPVLNIHRRCAEISTYIRNRNRDVAAQNYEEIRLQYLMGKLDDAQFREAIYERSCLIEKRREELQILSTFETAVIERLNKLSEDSVEIHTRKILRSEYFFESEYENSKKKDDKGKEELTEGRSEGSDDDEESSSSEKEENRDYAQMLVKDLKEILKRRNLPLTGLKADLVTRLQAHDEGRVVREREDAAPRAHPRITLVKRRRHKRGKVRTSVKNAPKSGVKRKSTSAYMNLPLSVRREMIQALYTEVITETDKIVDFCNKAFKDNFLAMGYKDYPILTLNEEYQYPAKIVKPKVQVQPMPGMPVAPGPGPQDTRYYIAPRPVGLVGNWRPHPIPIGDPRFLVDDSDSD